MDLKNIMNIELAKEEDIESILNILKERCIWLKQNNINQWGDYYTKKYNKNYFNKVMKNYKLYILKKNNKIIGVFLLKEEDLTYWKNEDSAYYIHHFATKIGYPGSGREIIKFIEKLAKITSKKYIRLDCTKTNNKLNKYYENQGFIYKGSGEFPYSYNLWEKSIK